jgi:hypothetical protein
LHPPLPFQQRPPVAADRVAETTSSNIPWLRPTEPKQIGSRTFRLHHTGWTYDDNGNPTGSFIINETETVASNGMSYTGNFDFKVYDTNGDYISGTETTGTIAASRITVD